MKNFKTIAGRASLVLAAGCLFMGCLEIKTDGAVGEDGNRVLFRFGDPAAELWGYNKKKKKPFPDDSSIGWSSSRDGDMAWGKGRSRIKIESLSPGDHRIKVWAGSGNDKVKDKIEIRILNDAPVAAIISPAAGDQLGVADTFTLRASGSDTEDDAFSGGLKDGQFRWTITGPTTQTKVGRAVAVSDLRPGSYTATLVVTDRAGASAKAHRSFRVVNRGPVGTIEGPSSVTAGGSITLSGEMFDHDSTTAPRDPNSGRPLPVRIDGWKLRWSSSRDGALGSGGSITAVLSNGSGESTEHTITLSAEDEFGARGEATFIVRITNRLPSITILSPNAGQEFTVVQSDSGIRFRATVSDPDGRPIADQDVTWYSHGNALPNRGTDVINTLSAGRQEISVRVKDADGGVARVSLGSINVKNQDPTVVINSPSDGDTIPVAEAEAVTLSATVNDPDGFAISDSHVVWSSTLHSLSDDRGRTVINRLDKGRHWIFCTVTDKHGGTVTTTVTVDVINQAPTARITSPSVSFQQQPIGVVGRGSGLRFVAHVTDPDGFDIDDSDVVWTSSIEGELASRGAYTYHVLSKLGLHRISCRVTDRHGDSVTSDAVTIHVINLDPRVVTIRAKRYSTGGSLSSFSSADTIRFEATIDDPDGFPIEDAKIEWSSSVDGDLAQTGSTITTDALSVSGARTRHRITCRVTDQHGGTAESSIRVVVTNEAPSRVRIGAPADGAEFKRGETIKVRGRGRDPEDGPLRGENLRWLLQKPGQSARTKVGTGRRPRGLTGLPAGDYTLFLRAVDSDGRDKEASVSFTIKANEAPVVTISSPAPRSAVDKGTEVVFQGSADDPETGDVSGSLLTWTYVRRSGNGGGAGGTWSSPQALGSGHGKEVRVSDLRPGGYRITLTARDPADASITATMTIRLRVKRPAASGNSGSPATPANPNATASSGIAGGVATQ